jgi:hypothetical protein
MNIAWSILSITCLVVTAACGGGDAVTITDQTLQGVIGGEPWEFEAGEAEASSFTVGEFAARLFGEPHTVCGSAFEQPAASHILLSVPDAVGSYALSFGQNSRTVTLYDTATSINHIAVSGAVDITEITATTISGGMHVRVDSDNEVDGLFELTICE